MDISMLLTSVNRARNMLMVWIFRRWTLFGLLLSREVSAICKKIGRLFWNEIWKKQTWVIYTWNLHMFTQKLQYIRLFIVIREIKCLLIKIRIFFTREITLEIVRFQGFHLVLSELLSSCCVLIWSENNLQFLCLDDEVIERCLDVLWQLWWKLLLV